VFVCKRERDIVYECVCVCVRVCASVYVCECVSVYLGLYDQECLFPFQNNLSGKYLSFLLTHTRYRSCGPTRPDNKRVWSKGGPITRPMCSLNYVKWILELNLRSLEQKLSLSGTRAQSPKD